MPRLISLQLRHFFLCRLSLLLVERDYTLIFNRSCVGLLSPTCYRSSRISRGPHQNCHYTAFIWRRYRAAGLLARNYRNQYSIPGRSKTVSSPKRHVVLGPSHAPNQWLPQTFSKRIALRGEGVKTTTPSCAEAKDQWSYPSTPPHALLECTGTTLMFIFFYKIHFIRINGKHKVRNDSELNLQIPTAPKAF